MTYYWKPGGSIRHGYRPRWGFVTDEDGDPLRAKDAITLQQMPADGWVKLGTWPVGKHPADLWDVAKAGPQPLAA